MPPVDRVARFAAEATRFQVWVLRGTQSGNRAVREGLRRLSRLYAAGLKLPPPSTVELSAEDEYVSDEPLTSPSFRRALSERLPFQLYWQMVDQLEMDREPESHAADLMDTIDDVYRDVVRGLILYKAGKIGPASHHWALTFRSQWGGHALSAARALHEYFSRLR